MRTCIIAPRIFGIIYKTVLADLKELMGTANDVLVLVSSGTGAMEASVTNCFSPGDRVIVCSAGKFGERWGEITKAYGLNMVMIEEPYGKAVQARGSRKGAGRQSRREGRVRPGV